MKFIPLSILGTKIYLLSSLRSPLTQVTACLTSRILCFTSNFRCPFECKIFGVIPSILNTLNKMQKGFWLVGFVSTILFLVAQLLEGFISLSI